LSGKSCPTKLVRQICPLNCVRKSYIYIYRFARHDIKFCPENLSAKFCPANCPLNFVRKICPENWQYIRASDRSSNGTWYNESDCEQLCIVSENISSEACCVGRANVCAIANSVGRNPRAVCAIPLELCAVRLSLARWQEGFARIVIALRDRWQALRNAS
jgi:hypothetical protein